MKRTLLLVIWSILTISIYAQVPQGISHQATIRNNDNELITSSPIGLRVSILPGSVEGIPVYVETHHPTSNSNGLITYVIGSGTVVSGVFSDIDWTSGIYFLKTEVDPLGGTDYVISGATQFRTVPYAFHAETAESFTETDPVYSADPAFSITDAGSGAVITDAERTKLGGIADGAEVNVPSDWTEADNTNDAFIANKPTLFTTSDETDPVYSADPAFSITDAGSGAVITDAERTKLGGIAEGAEVNVQSDWTEVDNTSDAFIANKPTLFTTSDETDPVYSADPAFSITDAGSGAVITDAERTKLGGIANGAEVNVQSDWTEADNTSDAYIANKPTLFTNTDETDPVVGAVAGIIKANGTGTISAATAGTDYLSPTDIGTTVQAYDPNTTILGTDIDLTSEVTGTLPIANGGTGQTTASDAINALVPDQTGNSGNYLSTDGSSVSWTTAGGGSGSGLSEYAYVYNLDAQVVPLEADMLFSNNGVIYGTITHAPGTSMIVLGSAGHYSIWFNVAGVEPNQFTIFQNGAPVAGAGYGSGAGTQINSGMVIINVAAGDVLTLRNHTSSAAVTLQTLAGGTQINVNASILIQKIAEPAP